MKLDSAVVSVWECREPKAKEPRLIQPANAALTAKQECHLLAYQTAMAALREKNPPWCGGNPNHVVLDDPEKPGLLVYILRPKPAMNQIPVGGHYRVSVSTDGKTTTQIDQLFASCLTMPREPEGKKGELVALSMSHLVSSRPLETHVFLSLQEKLPFYVITSDGRFWLIDSGKVEESAPKKAGDGNTS